MKKKLRKTLPILTIVGIGIYLLLFCVAAYQFPGGNSVDACQEGFSFLHNYWCDLMSSHCPIGVLNASMLPAKIGHIVLSITTAIFFFLLPFLFENANQKQGKIIRIFGILSMSIFVFMFTSLHNQVINGTAVFSSIALITAFFELKKMKNRRFFYGAIICLFCCLSVFIIYQSGFLIYWLALIQKIALIVCLSWMVWVCLAIRQSV